MMHNVVTSILATNNCTEYCDDFAWCSIDALSTGDRYIIINVVSNEGAFQLNPDIDVSQSVISKIQRSSWTQDTIVNKDVEGFLKPFETL